MVDVGILFLIIFSLVSAGVYFYFQNASGCAVYKKYDQFTEELNVFGSILANSRVLFNFCSAYIFYYFCLKYSCAFGILVAVLMFFLTNISVAYYGYFKESLTFLILSNNFKESLTVLRNTKSYINKKIFYLSFVLCLLQIVFFCNVLGSPEILGTKYLFYFVLFYWVLSFINISLTAFHPQMLTGAAPADKIFTEIGLVPFWFIELILSYKFRIKYVPRMKKNDYQLIKLADIDVNLLKNICIIQIESLDAAIVEDETVAPFLNSLKKQSIFCRVQSTQFQSGSADADFQMIFGDPPIPEKIIMYKLRGYDFKNANTIAKKAINHGFVCDFFHNFKSNYYNRMQCLKHAGFNDIVFAEKILEHIDNRLPMSFMTVDDNMMFAKMYEHSSQHRDEKYLQFAITCTSHSPWEFLRPEQKCVFRHGEDNSSFKKYSNSIHNVDSCLKEMYSNYPKGSLFIIYADHNSNLAYNGNDCKTIPIFVSLKGKDLSNAYLIDKQLACGGELFFINIVKWIHQLLS